MGRSLEGNSVEGSSVIMVDSDSGVDVSNPGVDASNPGVVFDGLVEPVLCLRV